MAAPLQRALSNKGYTTPSPIQAQAVPLLLEGADLLGSAQTGTGKTAAFSLPILHFIHEEPERLVPNSMRALVLTPTRELAAQVAQSFEEYGKYMRMSVGQVYGGVSFGPQIKMMRRGVDILVACPGRLLDLHEQGHVHFDNVEFFVLDEADRMLDMGFIHDIRKIVAEIPEERQSLFFSATFSKQVVELAETILTEPEEVRIAPQETTAEKIDHRICFLQAEDKMSLLREMIDSQTAAEGENLTLVFSRTKHGADRLAKNLERLGMKAEAIHGNKTQAARQRALDNFKRGRVRILVATDVAARGIDVKGITLVINYDIPNDPEAYVHRIGRTARADAHGVAMTFCTSNDMSDLKAIEKLIDKEIPIHSEHAYHREGLAAKRRTGGRHAGPKERNNKRPFARKRNNHGKRFLSKADGQGAAGPGQRQGKPKNKRRSKQSAA